uniref:DHC_N1 domain-containing protein n=1 Tax=Steinernema glaseri TaxID=37863 RepID=A0A1I7ZB11_9BILA
MISVPFDFIERTILLAYPFKKVFFNPYPLRGHWRRYAIHLQNTTEEYDLTVNICDLPDLYCSMVQGELSVRIEDMLRKKHTTLSSITIERSFDVPPEAEKIDDQKKEMLQRLLRRSNGLTSVNLSELPKGAPALVDILEAIPRVWNLVFDPEVEDVFTAVSLVEKHARQRCLKQLNSLQILQRKLFPLVKAFLKECEFSGFVVNFVLEEEDFTKEMIRLIADNLKKRMARVLQVGVYGKPTLVDQLRKEMGNAIRGASFWQRYFGLFGNVEEETIEMNLRPYGDRSILVIVHKKDAR